MDSSFCGYCRGFAGSHVGSDVAIGQPLQELAVSNVVSAATDSGSRSCQAGEAGEHILRGHSLLTHARRRGLHSDNHTAVVIHQIVVVYPARPMKIIVSLLPF